MKDLLTIVIPCKNEGFGLYECVKAISKQSHIKGVKVVICDSSNDEESEHWIYKTKYDFMDVLNIKIIDGGYPAYARHQGSLLVTTPKVLFLDADIVLTNETLLYDISGLDFDLVTTRFSTENGWNWVFRVFDVFQSIGLFLGSPFAVGGFQFWKTDKYWECGGWNPEELFAEDYSLSSKVNSNNFLVYNDFGVYTSARRFKNKGLFYMFRVMILSYLNRNNPKFFKHHHNYWK